VAIGPLSLSGKELSPDLHVEAIIKAKRGPVKALISLEVTPSLW
jgi:hypothetical protein